jgi:hypothetical protein
MTSGRLPETHRPLDGDRPYFFHLKMDGAKGKHLRINHAIGFLSYFTLVTAGGVH